MKIFEKLSRSLVLSSSNLYNKQWSELDIRNVILFQINVLGRNIKETTLARYLIKVTSP